MLSVFSIILPIFLIILIGYLYRCFGKFSENAASELNKAVVWVFLPALLFKICATAHISEVWNTGFVISYVFSCITVFLLVMIWRMKQYRDLKIASIDALTASYANTGYIGIPICLLLFGEMGLKPAMIATLTVVVVLFAISVVLIETAVQKQGSLVQICGRVTSALLKNPIVIAPILGFAWSFATIPIPTPMMHLLDLLAVATSPCALLSLGLFLAEKQAPVQSRSFIPLVIAKLLIQPIITAICVIYIFELPKAWAYSAIVLSALPTGTGPYMLAEMYDVEAQTVSQSILWSTVISVFSLSVLLMFLN